MAAIRSWSLKLFVFVAVIVLVFVYFTNIAFSAMDFQHLCSSLWRCMNGLNVGILSFGMVVYVVVCSVTCYYFVVKYCNSAALGMGKRLGPAALWGALGFGRWRISIDRYCPIFHTR